MQRLYVRANPNHEDVIPVWRNFCDHLCVQLKIQHPDLPSENFLTEWRKLRDLNLTQWQAKVMYPDNQYGSTHNYLEFADAESLLAFQLAWS